MLLNYIPFAGAFVGATIVFLAAAIEFDQLWWAVVITGLYLALTSIEANLVTPTVLGKTMRVGPVLVLLACAFWGFVWGLPGVIVAVPMLMVVREICCAFKTTRPIAIILGEDCDGEKECAAEKECSQQENDSQKQVAENTAAAPRFNQGVQPAGSV